MIWEQVLLDIANVTLEEINQVVIDAGFTKSERYEDGYAHGYPNGYISVNERADFDNEPDGWVYSEFNYGIDIQGRDVNAPKIAEYFFNYFEKNPNVRTVWWVRDESGDHLIKKSKYGSVQLDCTVTGLPEILAEWGYMPPDDSPLYDDGREWEPPPHIE